MTFFRCIGAGLVALSAIISAAPALASPAVALDSAVFVERTKAGSTGLTRSLELASRLNRGDRIVTIVTWQKRGGDGGFTVVNPLPRAVSYQTSASDDQQVSVDGGRTWGQLGSLAVAGRLATPEDVTHVRWHVPATGASAGRIAYSGIVR